MPYVPSLKTDGKSQDRVILDQAVENLSNFIANKIVTNGGVLKVYRDTFLDVANTILLNAEKSTPSDFAKTVLEVGAKYGYEGAFLGELNYACTRVIQRVPQLLAQQDKCGLSKGKELRYWLYAMTVDALTSVAKLLVEQLDDTKGVAGVFEDIKDEYKVRVNKSYEIEQILKSGDCYDTPYFNKVVEVVDEEGKNVGYTYVEFKNNGENVKLDKMPFVLVVKAISNIEEKKEIKQEKYL